MNLRLSLSYLSLVAALLTSLGLSTAGCHQATENGADVPSTLPAAVTPVSDQPKDAGETQPGPAAEPAATAQTSDDSAGTEPELDEDSPAPAADPARDHPFQHRSPAPSLDGGEGWLNTGGPIRLRDLRGKFVVLDFWTYCCINCMHILPELKKLEHAYPDQIVVIGVHSAKFDTEKGTDNIRQAILRHDIEHPVINDANHVVWNRYDITGWPALRVIDPEGKLVAVHGGEINFESMDRFFKEALPYYKKHGLLDETPIRFDLERESEPARPLKFPGKVLADEASNRLYISDNGHHRIVVSDLTGRWIENIGTGSIGADDGSYDQATFDHPQGLALHDSNLYVADTENHLIRKVDLQTKQVSTIAGTGRKNNGRWPGMDRIEFDDVRGAQFPDTWTTDATKFPLASPWALLVHERHLYIAMAGPHQIWRMSLDEPQIEVYAGNGREDIANGIRVPKTPPRIDRVGYASGYASFAQPSGLATDGKWLYVADSEGSAVRAVPFAADKEVTTVVGQSDIPRGQALFSFGDTDGTGDAVRLQHVLGIAHHDGKLYVADTYNNKVKVIDVETRAATTLAGNKEAGSQDDPARFDEPEGLSYAAGKLYVADTNNHQIRVIDLENDNRVTTLNLEGFKSLPVVKKAPVRFPNAQHVEMQEAQVRAVDGSVTFSVDLVLPAGWKINTLAPLNYRVVAKRQAGPVARESIGEVVTISEDERRNRFDITVPTTGNEGGDELELSLTCYYCRDGAEGLCKVASVIWSIPLSLVPSADSVAIPLRYTFR